MPFDKIIQNITSPRDTVSNQGNNIIKTSEKYIQPEQSYLCLNRLSRSDIGKIVVNTGEFLNESFNITPEVNNVSPIVKLCDTENDVNILGVIKSIVDDRVVLSDDKLTCVWVISDNIIEMGDFVTSSNILGLGMIQEKKMIQRSTLGISLGYYDPEEINLIDVKDYIDYDDNDMGFMSSLTPDDPVKQKRFDTKELDDGTKCVLLPIRLL